MRRVALAALLALTVSSLNARETKVLPILTDSSYCLTPGVSLVGGIGAFDKSDTTTTMYGVELSLACPALQLSSLDIKQQISIVYQSKEGLDTTHIEFNPHVMFDLSKDIQFGAGPGFGVILANAEKSDTVFGLNAGVSLNYDVTPSMFMGLEARYQWTTDAEVVSGVEVNLDNYRTLLKVGMHF